jgi:hypothetical protein
MTEHASLVTRERRPDGVALITIDNPPVNALTTPLFAELLAISETYRVRFAGSTDIGDAELDDAVRSVTEPAYIRELGGKYLATFDALAAVPCIVIAAITGIAFDGRLGGAVFRMPRLIGPSISKKMLLGERQSPRGKRCGSGLSTRRPTAAGPWLAPLNWPGHSPPAPGRRRPASSGLSTPCASYATDARARLREFFARGARTRARSQNRSPRRRSRHCSAKASAFKW